MSGLHCTLLPVDLRGMHMTPHPKQGGTNSLNKKGHTLQDRGYVSPEKGLNKFKTEVISSIFSYHNGIKLSIYSTRHVGNSAIRGKLNNMLLNYS